MIAKGEWIYIVSSHSRCLYIGATSALIEKRNPGWQSLPLPDAIWVLRLGSAHRDWKNDPPFASLRMTELFCKIEFREDQETSPSTTWERGSEILRQDRDKPGLLRMTDEK